MDNLDKWILGYLAQNLPEVELGKLQEACKKLNCPHGNIKEHAQRLEGWGYLFIKAIPPFYYYRLSPQGEKYFWSWQKKFMSYDANYMLLLGLALSLIGNAIALVAYVWPRA